MCPFLSDLFVGTRFLQGKIGGKRGVFGKDIKFGSFVKAE